MMNKVMPDSISLVIPAYNEEMRIGKTMESAYTYLSENYPGFEIIVVDDGSTDCTAGVVDSFCGNSKRNVRLIKNGINRGKGYSVKSGILGSSGNIVVFSDADQSVPITELPKYIKAIEEGADIAIASRGLSDSQIIKRQVLWREAMGKTFNIFVRLIAIDGIIDTQCGFKCFKRGPALDLFSKQKLDGFAFDVEILYLAAEKGYSVKQIPAVWRNSPKSKVNPVFDSMRMLGDLCMIKRLHAGDFKNGA